jgi:large subunit ribosomal protein L19
MSRISRIEEGYTRPEIPRFNVGDTVDVHVLIKEGEKERVQVFNGTVIRKKGGGLGATYTVRRIVQGQGVERTFPLHSPSVQKVDVTRSGKVRRSRLYFLRDRTGKATRLKEIIAPRKKKPKGPARRPAAAPQPAPEPEPAPETPAEE